MVEVLDSLQLKDKKSLFVLLPNKESFVTLSARNLKQVKVISAHTLNTYEILHANTLVFSESALKELNEMHKNS